MSHDLRRLYPLPTTELQGTEVRCRRFFNSGADPRLAREPSRRSALMKRKLLITTAAAALAAGTMFAAAQGVQPQSPGASGPQPGAQGQPQGKGKAAEP